METYLSSLQLPDPELHAYCWQHTGDLYIRVLYAIVRTEKPAVFVELGTCRGYSTNAIGEALRKNRMEGFPGRLFTVDLHEEFDYRPPMHLAEEIEALTGNTQDPEIPARLRVRLGHHQPIDILFVDADHSYENTRDDFLNWLPLVRPAGLVLFHDIRPLFPHVEGSARHWEEIQASNPGRTSTLEGCEMGVLRLPPG